MTSVSPKTVENFGIEVNDKVQWHGWEPGGEYTKQITLKNVKLQTQKINYKVPSSRFFTTLYPKPVILTCGTSFSLPVTFRPLEKGQYEDKIEFQTKDGNFAVPVKAVLPKANLVIPANISFGMCAIKDSSEISFKLSNTSDVHTSFKWIFDLPFTIFPTTGSLAPKTSCMIKATFSPQDGRVYNANAVCQYENPPDMVEKSMKLEGTGKYSHVTVRRAGDKQGTEKSGETLLDFGQVSLGSSNEKTIYLHNPSPVNASFQIIQPSLMSNIDKVFTFSDYHGVIPPNCTNKIKVSYNPSCPSAVYVDYFEINVLGVAKCATVKCLGSVKGSCVTLESRSISFGTIPSGGVVTRIINITNSSDVDTVYQFLVDKVNSVFAFEATSGYLAAGATHSIVVKFRPRLPINYFRKVTCLIQNHEPLDVELFGTCHTELTKPAVLQQKHVEQYKMYIERGLSRISPEQLDTMFSEGKITLDEQGSLTTPNNSLETTAEKINAEEAFFDDSSVGETAIITPHISLDHAQVSFGKCPGILNVQQKTVNITNHTKGKVTCNWLKDCENVFTVSPDNIDILPLQTASFTVTFRPNKENQIFGTELECFVSYKAARDYRLVEDKTLSPPWCVTVFFSGETFPKDVESFLPRVEFDTKELVFPAVTSHNTSYRTLVMVNYSPNPVLFDFQRDPSRTFRCKPSKGILKEGLQIIMFRYEGLENKISKIPLNCCLNNEEKYNEEFCLVGSAESPKLHLENKAMVYFRPTCIGGLAKQSFKVQNRNRIPITFDWKATDIDGSIVHVEPQNGTIFPGETQAHVWSFCPMEEKKYLMKWKLCLRVAIGFPQPKNVTTQHSPVVRVVGLGVMGKLNCVDSKIDFGKMSVGTSLTKQIVLCNPTDCDVSYRLSLLPDVANRHERPGIELTKPGESIVPARTNSTVEIRAWPRRRAVYETEISYQLASAKDSDTYAMFEKSLLCNVMVEGVYPTLTIQDVRATGSGSGYSKVQLWKLLSLETFNNCLNSDPLPNELRDSVATRYSTRRRAPVFTRAVANFNFGSASEGSEDNVIYLSLLNNEAVPVDWVFLFPNDLQLEIEYWAETGEYTTEELHELQTLGHHLFSIEPKSGVLAPGEAQTVVMTYQHSIVGINRLPIMFKIIRGREVLLNFTGVTVAKQQPFVHFMVRHMFTPVPVGLSTPPVQDFILHNGGSVNATYEIDLEPLKQLHKDNYDCEIFSCLNPSGTIAPGETVITQWVFAPLEAKTYLVDIPVRIIGCDTSTVTFTGIGYDRRIMGDTMPLTDGVLDIPQHQIAQVDRQLASLSQERISFGCVPLLNRKRRIVFLRNNLADHTISFRWILEKSSADQVVNVYPQYGTIKPESSTLIKVSFFSAGSPSLHDIDVECEITDHTLMEEYNRKLQKWYSVQEEKKHIFTITEKDVIEEKQKKGKKKSNRLSKSEGDLKKFSALPPIGSAKSRQRPQSGTEDVKEVSTAPDFEPPKPFHLHLGVAARTLEVNDVHIERDVLALTSSLMRKHILCERKNGDEKVTFDQMPQEELRVITETLSVILRGLLDDENFHQDVKELRNEPIPYFCQFRRNDRNQPRDEDDNSMTFNIQLETNAQDFPPVTVATSIPKTESGLAKNGGLMVHPDKQATIDQKDDNVDIEIRNSAEFSSLAEDIFENAIANLLCEANLGEVNLTARPRTIALPPSRGKKTR